MRIAVLSGGTGWHVQDLLRAGERLGYQLGVIDFRSLRAASPTTSQFADPLAEFDAALVRTIPAGSLEQIVFRTDVLHAAEARGLPVLNPPRAVEVCVDKYLTNVRLTAAGLLVPETIVCQRADDGMTAFADLGSDVVVKPLFGAEGRGMVRVSDFEIAWRTFRAIEQTGGVLYLQRFIEHPGWDLRAFVLGGRVLAAMKRTARGDWRTNVAQGGSVEAIRLTPAQESLALRAAAAVGIAVGGVDLLPGPNGVWYVIEVNAVPGWRALAPATGVDVASEIVRFLVEEYRK